MHGQNDLIHRINKSYKKSSKGQKLLANYIVDHYEKAVFLTAAKLGKVVGVSESTVVRFAIELGYEGYPKLQRALEELVKIKLTAIQRVEVTSDRINKNNILKFVLNSDMDKIKHTLEEIDEEILNKSVDLIMNAKTIYIIGVRSSAALASFMGFYFNLIFDNIKLIHTNSVSEMFEQIHRIGSEDVMIGISFPRYSRRTLKAMEYASRNEADVITITDSPLSPMVQFSDCSLIARSDMISFVNSLVAPLSIINAVIVALSIRKKETLVSSLESLEQIWNEYQVYDNDDDFSINYNLEIK